MRVTLRERHRLIETSRVDDRISCRCAGRVAGDALACTKRRTAIDNLVAHLAEPRHPGIHDLLALVRTLGRRAAEIEIEELRHCCLRVKEAQLSGAFGPSRVTHRHERPLSV